MLSVILDVPFRVGVTDNMGHTRHRRKENKTQQGMEHPVTDNMGHTRHRRKANKTQHGMEHPESLTIWDTQDTGGRQTKHNREWNIQSH
jgi:hypothetical protein